MRNLLFLILIGLVVYTIIDVIKSDRDERSGVPAPLWILLIVALPVVGSIGWLVASRTARSRRPGGGTGGIGGGGTRPTPPTRGPRRPAGPLAPDDDPEFLWRLAEQQRQAKGGQPGTGSGGSTDTGLPGDDGAHGNGPHGNGTHDNTTHDNGTHDGDTHDGGHDTPGPRTTP